MKGFVVDIKNKVTENMVSILADKGWYHRQFSELRELLQSFFDEAPLFPFQSIQALVMPHAGYSYSGYTAAVAAKQIEGHFFNRIIIIGPSHHVHLPHAASIPLASGIVTPLGVAPLDTEVLLALSKHNLFKQVPKIDQDEHSVQIEIPFFQMLCPEVPIVPIVVGQLDQHSAQDIADALRPYIDPETLVVISSDFTHYGKAFGYLPFSDHIPERIEQLDMSLIETLCGLNEDEVYRAFEIPRTVCGEHAFKVLAALFGDELQGKCVHYDMSANKNQDWSHSVSYAGMVYESLTGWV